MNQEKRHWVQYLKAIALNLALTLVVFIVALGVSELTVRWLGTAVWIVGMYFVIFVTSKYVFRVCRPPSDDTENAANGS